MQITREADYAIRTLLEVASQPEGSVTTASVARRRLVPRPFLRKIVPRLVAAGLLRTARGGQGGLYLMRPAEQIDLLTIIESIQRPIAVNVCVLDPSACLLQPTCPVHEVCRLAHSQLVELFGSVTLASLVQRGARRDGDAVRIVLAGGRRRKEDPDEDARFPLARCALP